jgi:RNA polymerase sigma-32 factor
MRVMGGFFSCSDPRRHYMQFSEPEETVLPDPEAEMTGAFDTLKNYLHEASKHPLMTREEEGEMALRVRMDGDKRAMQTMVLANLRLVIKIAFQYRSHLNLLDLIQEGNMGLVRAVGKYDPEKGTRFSTYASFWIRAYMLKYLMDSWSMVKIGTKDSERRLFYSLNRERAKLEKAGIAPSAEILAHSLEVSATEIEDMEQRLYHGDVSLDAPHDGEGESLMDIIASNEDIEERLIKKNHREILHKGLGDFKKLLNEKECFIFDNRIMAENPLTLREIGERFHTSRESVRQAQVKISRSLMKNLRSSQARPCA